MTDRPIKILGVAGSLRAESWNKKLLRAAAALAPEGASVTEFDLAEIPLYNEDLRTAGGHPAVTAFREAIAAHDALLLVTPEYNYGIPGVLKNALDWASRPPSPPFAMKPSATLGGSPGLHGAVRAQTQLRELLLGLGAIVCPKPEVYVGKINEKFDAEGRLTDEATAKLVRELVGNLVALARRF
ncbi:MAG: NAD(P)H-dependent oxidoreductase [Myxococcales bacterium]|nr:NAD(P)H-dependent oxidoreductase [Myxococcales bacterium]